MVDPVTVTVKVRLLTCVVPTTSVMRIRSLVFRLWPPLHVTKRGLFRVIPVIVDCTGVPAPRPVPIAASIRGSTSGTVVPPFGKMKLSQLQVTSCLPVIFSSADRVVLESIRSFLATWKSIDDAVTFAAFVPARAS